MGCNRWFAGLALVAAGLAGTVAEAFGADADLPAIRILVVNKIGVPPTDVLVRAQSETARIYAAVGVRLEWAGQPALPRLVMMIPSDSNLGVGVEDVAPDAMGAAPAADEQTGRVAYAFYGRIEALAKRGGIDAAKVLGIVMAHEIGHLLLGRGAHSSAGIMSGRWGKFEMDLVAVGLLGFTKEQADLIRRAVVGNERASETSGCERVRSPGLAPVNTPGGWHRTGRLGNCGGTSVRVLRPHPPPQRGAGIACLSDARPSY